jgi:hypothetical protein
MRRPLLLFTPRPVAIGACLLVVLLVAEPCPLGYAASPPVTSPPATQEAKAAAKRVPLTAGRRIEFVSAMLLWFAVVTAGLVLLALVMVWGRRLRHAVRRPPRLSTVPNPFWYLKKSPSAVAGSAPEILPKKNETGRDADGRSEP